jgi:hypothetical protein
MGVHNSTRSVLLQLAAVRLLCPVIRPKRIIRVEYSSQCAPIVCRSSESATLGDILVRYGDLGLDGRGGPASTAGAGT